MLNEEKPDAKRHVLNDSVYMKQLETVTRLESTNGCRRVGGEGGEAASLLRGCRAGFCLAQPEVQLIPLIHGLFAVIGIEPRALHVLGKHATIYAVPTQVSFFILR